MKFQYASAMGKDKYNHYPLIDVVFKNPENQLSLKIKALVDSGATDTYINGQIADALGIKLEDCEEDLTQGIVGPKTKTYRCDLILKLAQDNLEFNIKAFIIPDLKTTALLGQNGFFEFYKVVFNLNQHEFEVIQIPPFKKK
ncbi:MAG: retroviral-like aspartic protease [Candidatus Sungbacteria bacterium]|uniref:Retroviral-like aspartic protease n=1 Tax=Candidatus Sungiibacteriota bacterium TaxID=2750080 RepID=A0A9D6QU96_9BACT|nr:retroviral-like aspartic protease [Candidatus Sungbacteria bacterium]